MEYIYVEWVHNFEDEPTILISELDEKRNEIRKIELYKNGSVGYAYNGISVMGTGLSSEPIPELKNIASDTQFIPKKISKEEFEGFWKNNVLSFI